MIIRPKKNPRAGDIVVPPCPKKFKPEVSKGVGVS
jgi:hypothetical protein